jgi:hypothetical protein
MDMAQKNPRSKHGPKKTSKMGLVQFKPVNHLGLNNSNFMTFFYLPCQRHVICLRSMV